VVSPFFSDDWLTIFQGDCRSVLRHLPPNSVHLVVTSPPYWNQRDYGTEPQEWADGWTGELGREPSPIQFVQHLVGIFDDVRRVLRDDGVTFLNIADSWVSRPVDGIKRKDMALVPQRLLIALQDAGWYVRSDIIWQKGGGLPESRHDRPSKSYEHIFMLTKCDMYYFDQEAVREPVRESSLKRMEYGLRQRHPEGIGVSMLPINTPRLGERFVNPDGRYIRDIWPINIETSKTEHYAPFPSKIPERAILAATSEKGCCAYCGTPYRRVIEKAATGRIRNREHGGLGTEMRREPQGLRPVGGTFQEGVERRTVGWQATCGHDEGVVPCTVLDPFVGSGTTLLVAQRLGRRSIGIDLNPEYVVQTINRNRQVPLGV
jgi:DNA modification methylase